MNVFATLGSAVLEQSQDLHPAVAGHFPRGDLTTLTNPSRRFNARFFRFSNALGNHSLAFRKTPRHAKRAPPRRRRAGSPPGTISVSCGANRR